MSRPQPQDFRFWFQSIHGQEPFPWQVRLFEQWLCPADSNNARWPRSFALPPASGKTSLIDLAVFALACGSPCARRRIAFVVDRRIIVDEAARRAERIAEALKTALGSPDSPLYPVARALEELGADPGEPLVVARLRGGMELDESWARNPAQPVVLLSTVDQVGSRLLFRAYSGAGKRSWPIAAGLLGVDTLFLIDEAHCARPFWQTIQAIEQRWQAMAECRVGPGILAVQLSATLPDQAEFDLNEDDYRCEPLVKRLRTPKRARLVTAKSPARKGAEEAGNPVRRQLESEILKRASEWLREAAPGVLAIVVNRVASARRIFEELELPPGNKLLLTGRVRPWERDRLLESWLPRIRAGRNDPIGQARLAVVATQCIEVGADFDFDFLITEGASLDALRQRFGRLDRLGDRASRLSESGCQSFEWAGEIIVHEQQVSGDGGSAEPDPVYSESLARTWNFLSGIATNQIVDFCQESLAPHLRGTTDLQLLLQSQPSAYPLLPAYLDLLSHTSPPPDPDVEIAAFLHGSTRAAAEVTLVWRAGLDPEDYERWADSVALQPPAPGEGCPVPLWEAKAWLENAQQFEDLAHDLEGSPSGDQDGPQASTPSQRKVLAWRGPEESVVRKPAEILPGDVLIVPCEYGGCTEFGWNPASTGRVRDIGDAVAASLNRRPVIRLATLEGFGENHPAHAGEESGGQDLAAIRDEFLSNASAWEDFPERQDADVAAFLSRLEQWAAGARLEWLQSLSRQLAGDKNRQVVTDEFGRPVALVGSRSRGEDVQTSSDTSTFRRGRPVLLKDHLQGVAGAVAAFANKLELQEPLRKSLIQAAEHHDLGKCDPRFQAWLAGRAFPTPDQLQDPLAKSFAISPRNWPAIRRARQLSGYPEGNRHEALSVAILMAAENGLPPEVDRDLVLHLVGSHHGHGRPWFPVVDDPDAPEVDLPFANIRARVSAAHGMHRLDRGAVGRFQRLLRRYGWWGLAYLEAILRLADQRRSAEEEANAIHD